MCQSLVKTRSLQAWGAQLTDVTNSACSAGGTYDTSHPEYWRCLVGRNARTVYHYSGTCKMGAASDRTAVVDPQLRSESRGESIYGKSFTWNDRILHPSGVFFSSPDDQRYRYGLRGRESMCEQIRKSDCFVLKYMYICVFLYVKAFGLFPKLKNLTT